MSDNEEIQKLNAHLKDLQNEIFELKRVVNKGNNVSSMTNSDIIQKQQKQSLSSSKRGSVTFSLAEGTNRSTQRSLQSHQQSQQTKQQYDSIDSDNSMQQDQPQRISSVFFASFEQQKQQISQLKQNRNQLLEALENVLNVISKDRQDNRDSKQLSKLKNCLKQAKNTKSIFKTSVNSLRQEFLQIGHIEPLNLTCDRDIKLLCEHSINQSKQMTHIQRYQNEIEQQANPTNYHQHQKHSTESVDRFANKMSINSKYMRNNSQFYKSDQENYNNLKEKNNSVRSSYSINKQLDKQKQNEVQASPLNKTPQVGKSKLKSNQINSILKDSSNENLNYSHTDMNSFYDNLNETLNQTKQSILNTNKLNLMLKGSSELDIQKLIQSKRFSLNQIATSDHPVSTEKKEDLRFWDQPLQTKVEVNNYESMLGNSEDIDNKISNEQYVNYSNKEASSNQTYAQNYHQQKQQKRNSLDTKLNNTLIQQEEIYTRQIIPVPLDMSQKTKDLKQKLQNNKSSSQLNQLQNVNNQINNNYSHRISTYENKNNFQNNNINSYQNKVNQQLSLLEQYKLQQNNKRSQSPDIITRNHSSNIQMSPPKYDGESGIENSLRVKSQMQQFQRQQTQVQKEDVNIQQTYHTFQRYDNYQNE